jgi:hypothetical protein
MPWQACPFAFGSKSATSVAHLWNKLLTETVQKWGKSVACAKLVLLSFPPGAAAR